MVHPPAKIPDMRISERRCIACGFSAGMGYVWQVSAACPTGQGCKGSFLVINPCGRWVECPSSACGAGFGRQFERPVWADLGFHFGVSVDRLHAPTVEV